MYKTTVIIQTGTRVPWEDKMIQLGRPLVESNRTVRDNGTIMHQRTWETAELANEWAAWTLTSTPGVISAVVEEVV
jgi:hypothetical protein